MSNPAEKKIQKSDIEHRLRSLKSDVDTVKNNAIGAGVAAVGVAAIVLVILAFVLGRSRGKAAMSFIEVRRG